MAQNFQPSSFIPKKTLASSPIQGEVTKGSINIFLLISVIIFVVSLLGAGGVFLYERVLIGNVEEQKASLERAREAFEPSLIEVLARLDTRIEVAEDLIANHITVSPFFGLLETLTLKTVRFNGFDFSRNELGNLDVVMEGVAQNYTAVALQADLFGNNENIQDPIFSNFTLDDDGSVKFNLSLSLDSAFLLYENNTN